VEKLGVNAFGSVDDHKKLGLTALDLAKSMNRKEIGEILERSK